MRILRLLNIKVLAHSIAHLDTFKHGQMCSVFCNRLKIKDDVYKAHRHFQFHG